MSDQLTTAQTLGAFERELESQGLGYENIEAIVRDAAHALIYGEAAITVSRESVKS